MTILDQGLERRVWVSFGERCANPNCRKGQYEAGLDIHHVIPQGEGGKDVFENLILLCAGCHRLYHSKLIGRFAIQDWWKLHTRYSEVAYERVILPPKLFKEMAERIYQGRPQELITNYRESFFKITDLPKCIELGIKLIHAYHVVHKDLEASEIIHILQNALSNYPQDNVPVRLLANFYIYRARVERALGNWERSNKLSNTAAELIKIDKYEGFEADYYKSLLDILYGNFLLHGTNIESFEKAEMTLGYIEEIIRSRRDKITLKNYAIRQKCMYWARQGLFAKVYRELYDSLNELNSIKYTTKRTRIISFFCLGQYMLMEALLCPSKQSGLIDTAKLLFYKSIKAAAVHGRSTHYPGLPTNNAQNALKMLLDNNNLMALMSYYRVHIYEKII